MKWQPMNNDTDDQVKDTMDTTEEVVEEVAEVEEEKVDEVTEWKNKYLRALADYQNLERQTQTWKEDFSSFATANFARKILESIDDLEKAQEHLNDNGLALSISKLKKVLVEEGIEEVDLLNKDYDPNLAEVVTTQPGDKDNVVIEILQKGYRLGDRVLRPAKVVVSTVT